MYRSVYLALVIIGLSCSKSSVDTVVGKQKTGNAYTDYLIAANQHSATPNGIKLISKSSMHFEVLFDSSCIYTNKIAENMYDINKLYGFSDCGSAHHQNSARVGWLWNGKAIELYAYCYIGGERKSKLMGTLQPGDPAAITISVQPQQYIFEWNGKQTIMPRHCGSDQIEGYQLYPYFGGDEVAPHDIHVFVKDLN